jgi:hypothetical protein
MIAGSSETFGSIKCPSDPNWTDTYTQNRSDFLHSNVETGRSPDTMKGFESCTHYQLNDDTFTTEGASRKSFGLSRFLKALEEKIYGKITIRSA